MDRRAVFATTLTLLLISMLTLAFNIDPVSSVDSPGIVVDPPSTVDPSVSVGMLYTVSIYTDYTGGDVIAYQFTLSYNPDVLEGFEVVNGDLVVGGSAQFKAGSFNETSGQLSLTVGFYFVTGEVTAGPGILANVTFRVVGKGTSDITIGPETMFIGWDDWEGKEYSIIDAETMPTHIQHGYFRNTIEPVVHDIAVVGVAPSPTSVRLGELVDITVVVENQGTENETFDVIVYANVTVIETRNISNLEAGANMSIAFSWNTTEVKDEIYARTEKDKRFPIKATVSILPGETDTADNTLVSPNKVRIVSHYITVLPESTMDPSLTPGKNYTVSIYTDYNGSDIWGWQFSLTYNPAVLQGVSIANGDLITEAKDPSATFYMGTFNNTLGRLSLTSAFFFYMAPDEPYVTSGPGILANISFTVVGIGDSDITLVESQTELIGYKDGQFYEIVSDWRPNVKHIIPGYFKNTAEIVTHDVAVVSVTFSPTSVKQGEPVNITVVVENQGTVTETFTVAAYYDIIQPNYLVAPEKTVQTLEAGASTSLSFLWNTAYVPAENYTITAVAQPVPRETYIADNILESDETVTVTTAGVHDIAVISVAASPTQVTAGELVTITTAVTNQGDFSEVFSLIAYYYTTMIEAANVTLDAGETKTETFTWDTTGVPPDTYMIVAEATVVEGEVDTSDNMRVDGTVTVTSPPAPPMLSIKLSGEHDYLFMENVKVRIAALVKDAATMEPVSDADVTIEIYDSDGVLWVSDVMVERLDDTGIYEWKSQKTIRQLRLQKGVYLVHVQASWQGGPTASDILEFHVDPPAGGTNQTLYHIAFTAVALVGLAGLILNRRKIADTLRKLNRRN